MTSDKPIPDDIMREAEALYDSLRRGSAADAIARAILAERERCAAKADKWADDLVPFGIEQKTTLVLHELATAIRNGA